MSNMELFKDVKDVFDQLSTDGYIGDCHGELAYGYLRVSSSGQAEEGRSGLPRQIMHVHETAAKHKLKIPWELVFADDHTGFQFKDRPALDKLRREYRMPNRRANAVVIENLDRLSRNADWHQGFLLDEMQEYSLSVIFWKSFSSRIERVVMGAISQDGMEQEIRRMAEGIVYKARSGRVTARTRAYGYNFVDSNGEISSKMRKDTHYALHPEEAEVVKLIFQKVALEGKTLRSLATYLQERFSPPGRYKHWQARQISQFIRNPLYKGEFAASRFKTVQVPSTRQRPNTPINMVTKKIQRPKEEWIIVPVPSIVSPELWDLANRILDKNAQMARRNAKRPFLLTGLLRCPECGNAFSGGTKTDRVTGKVYVHQFYRCIGRRSYAKHMIDAIGCTQSQIACHKVDDAVWSCICQALLEPKVLLDHLENKLNGEDNTGLNHQIKFIQKQLVDKDLEDDKLYRAYLADVFDEQEYAARRQQLKESKQLLEGELEKLEQQAVSHEEIEEQRTLILAIAEQVRKLGVTLQAPFEIKRRIIAIIVDKITLNVNENRLILEGAVPGTFSLDDTIECVPALKPHGQKQRFRLI